jgi:aspartyl-tRNA(Asn)/glutamyl-tRNA(Gln) amidotransferase subunit B
MAEFEAVIGLETHIQLNTASKIFCGCKADSWQDPPNTNICPVCTGLPGALPVLNRAVVEKAARLAAAMHVSEISPRSFFARKNYFYPDLPKGYQISQYDEPLARGGSFDLPLPDGRVRKVHITKLHVEEDAGKTLHRGARRFIDFNRCGVPLVEMVTGPDLRSADEVAQYLIRLRQLLRWLEVSDADMERGQLRCDANVSIRAAGEEGLNPKTEIKNVNSIANVRDAVQAEIERQIREVQAGRAIEAWTLDWDEQRGALSKMRAKETESDYRYFREPDLLPIVLEADWREAMQRELPELPLERRRRFVEQYGLPEYDAEILTEERSLSEYFERAVQAFSGEPKTVSNWLMNDVLRLIREKGASAGALRLTPDYLARIIELVASRQITASTGKELLEQVETSGRSPDELVQEQGLAQLSDDSALRRVAEAVLQANPQQVAQYRGGKTTLLGWFVGQVMRETGGKADPQLARKALQELLDV